MASIVKPFYLVWRVGGGSPTYTHCTIESATVECERLARANRGDTFVVMESKLGRRVSDLECIEYDDPALPF